MKFPSVAGEGFINLGDDSGAVHKRKLQRRLVDECECTDIGRPLTNVRGTDIATHFTRN